MTAEHAAMMSGPLGQLARLLADTAVDAVREWAPRNDRQAAAMFPHDSLQAVQHFGNDLLADLADYLPHAMVLTLTELGLQGVVTIDHGEAS